MTREAKLQICRRQSFAMMFFISCGFLVNVGMYLFATAGMGGMFFFLAGMTCGLGGLYHLIRIINLLDIDDKGE